MKGPKNLTGQAEHLMSRFIRQDDVPSVRNIEIRIVSLFRGDGKEAYNCNMYCRSTEKASQKTGRRQYTRHMSRCDDTFSLSVVGNAG